MISLENYIDFLGPNFMDNDQTNAKYRRSISTVKIVTTIRDKERNYTFKKDLIIPKELKVLNHANEWQPHPAVFLWYTDPDAFTRQEGEMIFYQADETIARIGFQKESYNCMLRLYQQANKLGLTPSRGWDMRTMLKIKPFPKEKELS